MNLSNLKALYASAHPGPGMLGLPIGAWDAWDAAISDAAPELFAAVEERDALRKAIDALASAADRYFQSQDRNVDPFEAGNALVALRAAIAAAREATKEKS